MTKLLVLGALVGKVSSVFTSTGTGGGNESTIMTFVPTLIHHGMIYVGLPYTCPELADISEGRGGSPWGAATFAGAERLSPTHCLGARSGPLPRTPRRANRRKTQAVTVPAVV